MFHSCQSPNPHNHWSHKYRGPCREHNSAFHHEPTSNDGQLPMQRHWRRPVQWFQRISREPAQETERGAKHERRTVPEVSAERDRCQQSEGCLLHRGHQGIPGGSGGATSVLQQLPGKDWSGDQPAAGRTQMYLAYTSGLRALQTKMEVWQIFRTPLLSQIPLMGNWSWCSSCFLMTVTSY